MSDELNNIVILMQPQNVRAAFGSDAVFSAVAVGDLSTAVWQERTGSGEWSASENSAETSSTDTTNGTQITCTLTVTAGSGPDGTQFRCVFYDEGQEHSAATISATLDVVSPPSIVTQPASANVNEGNRIVFSVESSGKYLLYQWQIRSSSNAEWVNMTSTGANSRAVSVEGAKRLNGYQFRCIVSNMAGSVISSTAMLTIRAIILKLQDEGDGSFRNVLPKGTYVFSVNADRDGLLFSLGFGNDYETSWLCENREDPFIFVSDGSRPIRILIYGEDGVDLDGCVFRPILEAGEATHAWTSPSRAEHDIANDYNYDWFTIGNSHASTENVVRSTLPCEMTLRYRPIWKDTL